MPLVALDVQCVDEGALDELGSARGDKWESAGGRQKQIDNDFLSEAAGGEKVLPIPVLGCSSLFSNGPVSGACRAPSVLPYP